MEIPDFLYVVPSSSFANPNGSYTTVHSKSKGVAPGLAGGHKT
jgi:hypothetical protein